MADKDLPVYPLPQESNGGNDKFDEESATRDESQDLHKTNRMQHIAYFLAFLVCQTGIILLFALTIMKVRTPKFSIRSATFETFDVVGTTTSNTTANPSFHLSMNAELGLKNNNFGDYKFKNSTVYFFHNGYPVGEAVVPKSKAGIRSTKKFTVLVNLSSTSKDPKLADDLGFGVITLKSRSKLSGKVELMKVLKKKKSTNMDCTLTIGVADRALRQISCK